uniref:Uncharacterized protein n=1 Tax=Anguilla anguilla TaxID=7936 RepID=A0A0E9SPA7_ANGAN
MWHDLSSLHKKPLLTAVKLTHQCSICF